MWILLTPINEDDPNLIELPANPFLKYLFNTSKSVMSNAVARMLIYFVAVCVLTLSALIHLVSERMSERANASSTKQAFIYTCAFDFLFTVVFSPSVGNV